MTRRLVFPLALAAIALAVPRPSSASTFTHMSQLELVRGAAAVVKGRVLEVNSFWDAARTNIFTEATFEVEERLIGDAPRIIVMRTFGGTVGDYSVQAHGFPEFAAGQRMVLFTKQLPDGAYEVLGYREGQFRLMRDTTGRALALPMVEEGMRYLTADGRTAPAAAILPLDVFKAQIRVLGIRSGRISN